VTATAEKLRCPSCRKVMEPHACARRARCTWMVCPDQMWHATYDWSKHQMVMRERGSNVRGADIVEDDRR